MKNPPANTGDPDSSPGLGRSLGEGNGKPIPVFLPGEFHGQRSLVGYWGGKESDRTERLTLGIKIPQAVRFRVGLGWGRTCNKKW